MRLRLGPEEGLQFHHGTVVKRHATGAPLRVHRWAAAKVFHRETTEPDIPNLCRPRIGAMDPLRILVERAGFFTRAEARDLGHDDRSVAALVRGREWHRIRRGFFTCVSHWSGLDEVGKHLLTAHTVLRSLGPAVAMSHVTAAVAHGITVWGLPLDRIHVTRLDGGTGRVDAGVVHHEGRATEGDVVEIGGHLVVTPPRAALEAATL